MEAFLGQAIVLALQEMEEEGGVESAINWSAVGLWAATAVGGVLLLTLYARYGGMAQTSNGVSRIGITRILVHLVVAVVGLALWIIYVLSDTEWSGWGALGLLVVAIGIGASMLFTKDRQRIEALRTGSAPVPGGRHGGNAIPAEQRYPLWLAAGHGSLAMATLVLVALNRAGAFG